MLICFVYSAGSRPLQVHREESDGYYYPHIAEQVSETAHRFFAGRLTGVPASPFLPADHPVSLGSAGDWSFPSGEPDGSWIALKFDRERDVLSIAADVFNVQRWYYHRHGEQWYLANSLRYLFRIAEGLEIEWRAASYMLHYGYLPRRLTPLKDVFELDASEVLTISRGVGTVSRRAHLPVHRRPVLDSGSHAEAVADTVREAVSREIGDLDYLMLPISGGMDSRFLLGCALSILPPEKITTLTFGWPSSFDFRIGTRLTNRLGVKNIPLPMDDRPVGKLLRENFATAEGMYCAVPDYPVAPFREAVPPQCFVLSGYMGDPVFGSKEGSAPDEPVEGREREMLALLRKSATYVPWTTVASFLSDPTPDSLHLERDLQDLPGNTMQERYDFWYFGTHTTNRTHHAVTPVRSRALFLMPFLHRRVLDLAFALPVSERLERRAYLAAMRLRYPDLFRFPTKRNFGFGAQRKEDLGVWTVRLWRKLWLTLDETLGPPLDKIIYRHPKFNYEHPRGFAAKQHQADVLTALSELKTVPAFESATLERARAAYMARRLDINLLRCLLTVHQWLVHYGKKGG